MEVMTPEAEIVLEAAGYAPRPMKRVEYDHLVAQGFLEDEKVELLFGQVVPMVPIDPAHIESVDIVHRTLMLRLVDRARVRCQAPFAATDDSEPEPDVYVVPEGDYWREHPARAFLVVEVSRSSLRRDRAKRLLYAIAEVDEYWIVNHPERCVEVYRDRRDGVWQSLTMYQRGQTVSPLAFPDVAIAVDDILPPEQ